MPSTYPREELLDPLPDQLWRRLLAEPDRAPEHLAVAVADRFAPQAAEFAAMHGAARNPERVAKLAKRKHVWKSRLTGAATGLGGLMTATVDIVTLGWTQGRMVFFIAAAYGFDPRDRMRPAELLYLWGVYGSPEEARKSLDREGERMAVAYAGQKVQGAGGDQSGLVAQLTKYFLRRSIVRAIPVVASPINAVADGHATTDLAKRAIKYYGG